MKPILPSIKDPGMIAGFSPSALTRLCDEIREEIISTVADTGGHLGASLGVVELTVALHHVYRSPHDKIIWDVGHQAYGHKLLTGRREAFHTLRQGGGISGFPKRSESEHDMFGVGHASTSISAALGFAKARDLRGEDHSVIAVIGDASISGGVALEAVNNAGQLQTDVTVILNDNKMSISPNVGALAKYLTRITSGQLYTRFERNLWKLLGKFPRGRLAQELASRVKEGLKQLVVPTILFEELGFTYFGPIDGHDLPTLTRTLRSVKKLKGPVLVHVITTKGKGYSFAEKERAKYHGVGKFDRRQGVQPSHSAVPTYTEVFGRTLVELAERDPRIIGITAAMPSGTGLSYLRDALPERFFDVGIAEQHAVTFAAGLACEGMKPVCAIYSTFLQRAFDQMIHDVALQKLPVVFAIDRGGVVGEDGPTHHGCFDLSFLRLIPGMVVMAPRDENVLRSMLATALTYDAGPVALRYPRGAGLGVDISGPMATLPIGKGEILQRGSDVCLLAAGSMVAVAQQAAAQLESDGMSVTVADMRFIKPLDRALLDDVFAAHRLVAVMEENAVAGGLGGAVLEWAAANRPADGPRVLTLGLPDRFLDHDERAVLLAEVGLEAAAVAARVSEELARSDGEPAENNNPDGQAFRAARS